MLVIAKLARLIGMDQLHIGTIVGKMDTPKSEVVHIDQEVEKNMIREDKRGHILEQKWYHLKPTFAVASGGLHPGHVAPIIKYLGKNVILQMGGGIHGHPLGTVVGARAARQAIEAVMQNQTAENYAKHHFELKKALDFFGKK
jgi:ribulose-bisphosphate carboxylase large chain